MPADRGRRDRRMRPRDDRPLVDRRVDLAARKRVAQMSPEEMKRTLLTHDLTGIKNRRAWEEADRLPVQAAVDADSLKWFNDVMGHEAGDRMLRIIAAALDAETDEAYHIAGDEFLVQGRTEEEVHRVLCRAAQRLQGVAIESREADGTVVRKIGLEISWGIGRSRTSSEEALAHEKRKREITGLRAARGEPPRVGLVRIPEPGCRRDGRAPGPSADRSHHRSRHAGPRRTQPRARPRN